jgi:hypothetical protein
MQTGVKEMFQIDLNTDGDLELVLPTNRRITVGSTVEGLNYIKKVILDHNRGIRNQPGYIGTFPTQHAVDKFLAEKRKRIEKERIESVKNKLGIDVSKMSFDL